MLSYHCFKIKWHVLYIIISYRHHFGWINHININIVIWIMSEWLSATMPPCITKNADNQQKWNATSRLFFSNFLTFKCLIFRTYIWLKSVFFFKPLNLLASSQQYSQYHHMIVIVRTSKNERAIIIMYVSVRSLKWLLFDSSCFVAAGVSY